MFNEEKKQIAMQMLDTVIKQIVSFEFRIQLGEEFISVKDQNIKIQDQVDRLNNEATALKNLIDKYDK